MSIHTVIATRVFQYAWLKKDVILGCLTGDIAIGGGLGQIYGLVWCRRRWKG